MLPHAAVIVLNWNGWQDTLELLTSLNQVTYAPLLVIVVDNASTDGLSTAKIKDWLQSSRVRYSLHRHALETSTPDALHLSEPWASGKHFLLIESAYNLGFCAGNNLGMNCALALDAHYLLVLNNDTLVAADFLQPLIALGEHDPQVGLIGGVITHCDDPQTIWWAGGQFDRFLNTRRILDKRPLHELPAAAVLATAWVSGCMMLIPARIYREFGGYPEAYFIWSEEWDYSLRLGRAGFTHRVVTSSRICHKVGHSLGDMKPLSYYYGLRNALIFKRKYLAWYVWYPYFGYYLLNRSLRFTQLLLHGRADLVRAGVAAISDYLRGRTGKWRLQTG